MMTDPVVVGIGGGHGLSASLRALRRVTPHLTAIVGVSDDGGSSGRIRRELGLVPPGDLRMALAALCGDDRWGRTWSRVVQHRFTGSGELNGHSLGNLLIAALWQETGDVVEGLDWVGQLLQSRGRVLPSATSPLDIVGEVLGHDPYRPDEVVTVTGQYEISTTRGQVQRVWLEPSEVQACPEAVAAIEAADYIVLGPGSWYSSVLPHLYVPGIRNALSGATQRGAGVGLVLNLGPQLGETTGYQPHNYLQQLAWDFPDVRLSHVLVDERIRMDQEVLRDACEGAGAELVLGRIGRTDPATGDVLPRHDPELLAVAFNGLMGRGSIVPWH